MRIVHQDCGQGRPLMVNADESRRKRGAGGKPFRKSEKNLSFILWFQKSYISDKELSCFARLNKMILAITEGRET